MSEYDIYYIDDRLMFILTQVDCGEAEGYSNLSSYTGFEYVLWI